ncbi:uncharacterized protein A4U43_C04F13150 [Asparagus officinalis]|uniref:Uncharacterized protein n=1 Tax=Asparagus officinalis TaxID=4686 RepID=A0A5P1F101_ASPOF|nr:uncharacterized protein A4U43_C04F13150 [Asparagus officinalis]
MQGDGYTLYYSEGCRMPTPAGILLPQTVGNDVVIPTREASMVVPLDAIIVDDRSPAREEGIEINMVEVKAFEAPTEREVGPNMPTKSVHQHGKEAATDGRLLLMSSMWRHLGS